MSLDPTNQSTQLAQEIMEFIIIHNHRIIQNFCVPIFMSKIPNL